jgi:hypothetical protein
MAPRLGHLLYWIASWIAVILIAGGIVVWLYFARPNYDPLGLVIVRLGHHCLAWGPCYPVLACWSISIELSAPIAMTPILGITKEPLLWLWRRILSGLFLLPAVQALLRGPPAVFGSRRWGVTTIAASTSLQKNPSRCRRLGWFQTFNAREVNT